MFSISEDYDEFILFWSYSMPLFYGPLKDTKRQLTEINKKPQPLTN